MKLYWASKHLTELCSDIQSWVSNEENLRHTTETDPDDPAYVLLRATAGDISPMMFGLRIGDCVHNLRCCLDHLALALAHCHTKPLPAEWEKASQFPIVGDRTKAGALGAGEANFRNQVQRIQGIDPAAREVVRQLQPFTLGSKFEEHPLWLLNQLSNVDKHRTIHVAPLGSVGLTLDPRTFDNCRIGPGLLKVFGALVTTDTPVARVPVQPIDPAKEMKLGLKPEITIVFSSGGLTRQPVCDGLNKILAFITSDVLLRLQPFLC